MNLTCDYCGITAADMPYEEMGLTLQEASDLLFFRAGNGFVLCQGCQDLDEEEAA